MPDLGMQQRKLVPGAASGAYRLATAFSPDIPNPRPAVQPTVCPVKLVATFPADYAATSGFGADGTYIYFVTSSGGVQSITRYDYPAITSPLTLYTAAANLTSLTTDGTSLYWIEFANGVIYSQDYYVYSMPVGGGAATLVHTETGSEGLAYMSWHPSLNALVWQRQNAPGGGGAFNGSPPSNFVSRIESCTPGGTVTTLWTSANDTIFDSIHLYQTTISTSVRWAYVSGGIFVLADVPDGLGSADLYISFFDLGSNTLTPSATPISPSRTLVPTPSATAVYKHSDGFVHEMQQSLSDAVWSCDPVVNADWYQADGSAIVGNFTQIVFITYSFVDFQYHLWTM